TGENTGISSNTRESSTGDGGKIIIDPILFTIEDGAAIAVNSQGTGIGGDIELTADTLNLDNRTINARTRSNTGGNITLTVDDILYMRRNSKISTTAGNEQFGGNGGNITINTPFIVAFPTNGDGNDITANAFLGNGGNFNITGKFLFGIESRDQLTTFNDITASSELAQDGTVEVNTPGIDPTRSLIQLPDGRINPQVSQNCQANGRGTKAEFYPIGTGGLPHNPESLSIPEPFNQGLIPLQLEQKNTPKLSIGKTQSQNNIELNKKESSIYTETLPCQQR
ncbi:MAG: filamentous hemagglutinin, partial [Rivularia sp. ALOHA_DT_140]|nr:filamentous hemagglutinin [Rivularia sp. ALOHA_DT_140]